MSPKTEGTLPYSAFPLTALPGLKPASSVKFNGINTNTFLKQFELTTAAHGIEGERRVEALPLYLPKDYQQEVTEWAEFQAKDWEKVKQKMLSQFNDEEDNKYRVRDLKVVARKQKKKPIKSVLTLKNYHRRFIRISKWLKSQERMGWQEETRIYLRAFSGKLLAEWEREKRHERRSKAKEEKGKVKLARVEDIFEDLKAILDDQEAYGGRRGRGREESSEESSEEESSESDSDSDESSYFTSEETSNDTSSDEEDDDETERRAKKKKGKGKKKSKRGGKSSKKDAKKEVTFSKETKSEYSGNYDGLKSDAIARNSEARDQALVQVGFEQGKEAAKDEAVASLTKDMENMKLFAARLQNKPPPTTFSASSGIYPASNPPVLPREPPPHLASNPNTRPNMPAALRGPSTGPFGSGGQKCFTCGGPHGFRDDDCTVMQDWVSRGIVTNNGRGTYYHRGDRFPLAHDLPPEYPTFRDWVEAREKYFAEEEGKGMSTLTGAYHYTPPSGTQGWRSQLGAHFDENGDIQAYDVEAAKRGRGEANSSQDSREEGPKRIDTRSEVQRRKEVEEKVETAKGREDKGGEKSAEVEEEDEAMTDATSRRKRSTTMLRTPLEERIAKTDVQEHLFKTNVHLSLEMLLAAAPELAKAVMEQCKRRRIPRPDPDAVLSYHGEQVTLPGGEVLDGLLGAADTVYAAPLGKLAVEVRGQSVKGLVDSGSMITVIGNNLRKSLGLTLTHSGGHTLTGINGDSVHLAGICKNVPITIGDSTIRQHIFVSPRPQQQLVLGVPFLRSTEAVIRYGPGRETSLSLTIDGKMTESVLQLEGEEIRRVADDRFGGDDGWGNE